jgi:hypothetical protein
MIDAVGAIPDRRRVNVVPLSSVNMLAYGRTPKASLSFVGKNGGCMKRSFLGCIILLSAAALGQQTKSPVSDVLRAI